MLLTPRLLLLMPPMSLTTLLLLLMPLMSLTRHLPLQLFMLFPLFLLRTL
jgi:hypothetical protein